MRIETGTLLNDVIFWHTEGLVQTWSKDRATIDEENQTVHCDGRTVHYDHLIDGGSEVPQAAEHRHGGRGRPDATQYAYAHRNTFLGVVPAELQNVFFIGFTRPLTGGIANISEMQSPDGAHPPGAARPLCRPAAKTVEERIERVQREVLPQAGSRRTPTDHLVNFGLYTQDVAEFIGIGRPLRRGLLAQPVHHRPEPALRAAAPQQRAQVADAGQATRCPAQKRLARQVSPPTTSTGPSSPSCCWRPSGIIAARLSCAWP